ncbi:TIGR03862 family flavoprotein [Aquimonas voraii]|uniref:TIGR03862 family flavoprotein n=1 Tax=Aquimonas voraii TaxID=265719 RepID=A0A1G6SVK5_9GAMM|nr:TIGR03862 family flavoprotein [Aquimonas voraii]SDD20813.1 hypothetical protein SAMN04488509_101720 [Aquimonas voraii]
MSRSTPARVAVVGGGPAGLIAAERLRAAGAEVDVYERMGSVGRKILIAGKGGLNLTHSEAFAPFVARYREAAPWVQPWLECFGASALRDWARGLGVETFVGTSGRVFPSDLKAAPLLRGWVRRLREQGVRFHVQHRLVSIEGTRLGFYTPDGSVEVMADAVVLALGGGSWAKLGSDGAWVDLLRTRGVEVRDLAPSNCGFECDWSTNFKSSSAGLPVKPVAAAWIDAAGQRQRRQGEFVLTEHGIEGSLIYALSADLRSQIERDGRAELWLDLFPERSLEQLRSAWQRARSGESTGSKLRKRLCLDGARLALVYERLPKSAMADAEVLLPALKALPLQLAATRPLDEAISSAGGVRREALDAHLMLRDLPGVFCAGEMLDWEAPTGGYLLTACFASGLRAAEGALDWLAARA